MYVSSSLPGGATVTLLKEARAAAIVYLKTVYQKLQQEQDVAADSKLRPRCCHLGELDET